MREPRITNAFGGPAASRLGQISWAFFDWANQPFFTLITTFIFFPYFASGFIADPVRGQEILGYTLGASGLLVAVLSPIFGAISDASGPRKPWIFVFSIMIVFGCAGLWFAYPGAPNGIGVIIVMLIVAAIGIESAIVFNNAMLPSLVPESHMGRLSGFGWGLGYIGGLLTLLIVLFGFALPEQPLFGLDPAQNEPDRLVGPLAAAWYLVFVLPMFLFTPDQKSRGIPLIAAVGQGFSTLGRTIAKLGNYRNVALFLLARMTFNDGLAAIFAFGGVYARGVFGWEITTLGIFGIILASFAAVGAFIGGRLDDRLGSKGTLIVAVTGLIVGTLGSVSITTESILFVIPVAPVGAGPPLSSIPELTYVCFGILIGLSGGPAQAAARTMMARLAPRELMTEFFGLYALSGKATAFAAPAVIAIATAASGTQRAGLFVIVVFLVVGLILLLPVREERASD